MAIQIRFRGALTTTVCRCPEKHKSMQAPTPTLQRVRSLTRAHHTIPEDQLSKQRTERSQLSQIHKSTLAPTPTPLPTHSPMRVLHTVLQGQLSKRCMDLGFRRYTGERLQAMGAISE
jgi:hypothetical protein